MGELARAGGAAGALGLAALFYATSRTWRIGGLVAWAAGCGALALWLAPAGHHRTYAAAAVLGVLVASGLAWIYVRDPWLLPVSVLACAPARIPVSLGHTSANLLLPLYVVVAGAALALAWELFGDESRSRELGRAALPLGAFVAWTGLAFTWSQDRRQGAIELLFYVLPFGLLAVSLARLPWRAGWLTILFVQLLTMGFLFALVGIVQYETRNIFWNPKVIVDNAYATSSWFYRVNSVFYDPSIYGRFLVVAILAAIVAVAFAGRAAAWAALVVAAITFVGLVPSFSQSSFVSLGVGILVVLLVLWRQRAVVPIAVAIAALLAVSLGVPQVRHRLIGKHGFSLATSGRSNLVRNGITLALHHPVVGVGTGAFQHAYGHQQHMRGFRPKKAASHDTPITVAAETGFPGFALLCWLLVTVFLVPFRANPVRGPTSRARLAFGLALVAIVTHSLFYNALFEDPLFWSAIALGAVAARRAAIT